jgi:4-deoxy-L-threo-5-hexosulose-uronate ketol-isomerase
MEVRYAPDPARFARMTTAEIRASFLIDNLFKKGKVEMVYSDVDRAIIGSAVPLKEALKLKANKKTMAADFFNERREMGVINIGSAGQIISDDHVYNMASLDCLYLGKGSKKISFVSTNRNKPALYYFVSYPAHSVYPTKQAKIKDAAPVKLGGRKEANQRTIYKYIHPDGIKSFQLVMGFTVLEEGSVWNTMAAHTHERRSEIYFYFNLSKEALVCHLMGKPEETRHMMVRNQEAVISPSWSIHAGAGTANYSFIWSMGGENQQFDDMDGVPIGRLG